MLWSWIGVGNISQKKAYTGQDLDQAAKSGNVAKVKDILDSVDVTEIYQSTLQAVCNEYESTIEQKRSIRNYSDKIKAYSDILIFLIKAGADRPEGMVNFAIEVADINLLEALFDAGEPFDKSAPYLVLAAKTGSSDILRYLLNKGASVNACDRHQQSALHVVCSRGETHCFDVLLATKDIDVNLQDVNYETPLDHFQRFMNSLQRSDGRCSYYHLRLEQKGAKATTADERQEARLAEQKKAELELKRGRDEPERESKDPEGDRKEPEEDQTGRPSAPKVYRKY